jgi:glutamyl-tRNA reductase
LEATENCMGLDCLGFVWWINRRTLAKSLVRTTVCVGNRVYICLYADRILGSELVVAMNLIVIGLNHRSAPVEVRERLAVPRSALGTVTCDLLGAAPLCEAAVLSTCNRVEVYALVAGKDEAAAGVRRYLQQRSTVMVSLDDCLYSFHDEDCIRHLLEVVSGLDSMVLGETEILGQVKEAYAAAHAAGATGMALNRLFQKAFSAAKHIRSTTGITRGSTSIANVGVELAERIFRSLAISTVMVIGTGEMSVATAKALRGRGAGTLLVCGRDRERTAQVAGELGGRAISYDDWPNEFPVVDIVISATSAPHPIITKEKLVPLMKARHHRPLFLIDIGVPRNVERASSDLENVYLYDIDDLEQIALQNRAAREREIVACRELLEERVARLSGWFADNQAALQQRYPNGVFVPFTGQAT